MYDIELNSDLLDLVEGKRVTVVGPSPHLMGGKRGSFIDQHDVVVRVNRFTVSNDLKEHYGSKTDIMFFNFGTAWMSGLIQQKEKNKEDFDGLKMLGCLAIKAEHSDNGYMKWPDDHISGVVKNANSINDNDIPFYWIGVKDYKTLHSISGCELYQGVLAVAVLLKYPIKELFVTGFTFYMDGNTNKDFYYPNYREDGKRLHGAPHGPTPTKRSFEFFKSLVKENPDLIKVDEKMQGILGI